MILIIPKIFSISSPRMNPNSFSILEESIRYLLSCPNLSDTCSIRLYGLCRISRIVFTISRLVRLSLVLMLYIEPSLPSFFSYENKNRRMIQYLLLIYIKGDTLYGS